MNEQERHRIADRLRTGPAQALANLVADLRSLLQLARDQHSDWEPFIEAMLREAEDGIEALREIIEDLHLPLLFRDLGFVPWLQDFVQRSRERYNLDVAVEIPGDNLALSPEMGEVFLRVVQEAMRNIYKHAQASQVFIRIRPENNGIVLEIEDNGLGIDLSELSRVYTDLHPKFTHGISFMGSWVARVNGELSILRGSEGGTVVRVYVPYSTLE